MKDYLPAAASDSFALQSFASRLRSDTDALICTTSSTSA